MFRRLMIFSPLKQTLSYFHQSGILLPVLPKVTPNIYRPCAQRRGLMVLHKSLRWAELELVLLYNQRGGSTVQAIHHPAISIRPQTDLERTAQ